MKTHIRKLILFLSLIFIFCTGSIQHQHFKITKSRAGVTYCTQSKNTLAAIQERFECGAVAIGDNDQEYASWTIEPATSPDFGSTANTASLGGSETFEAGGTAWEGVTSANITNVAEVWAGTLLTINSLPAPAGGKVFSITNTSNGFQCSLNITGSTFYLQNAGVSDVNLGTYSGATRYYVKLRAKVGTGANAECECWISTTTTWGASKGSSNTGTWTVNPRRVRAFSEASATTIYFKDVLWSATESHIDYAGKGY